MTNFSDVSIQLSQSAIVHHSLKKLEELEADIFFSIACNKDQIYRSKCVLFQEIDEIKINVITNNTNFGCISSTNVGKKINILSTDAIKSTANDIELIKGLQNSVTVSTSNIFAEIGAVRLGQLYESLPNTIFVMHDYDNHHWISNNLQVAIFSDVYAPSHQSDNLMASKVNSNILGGIPCGSNQWSMDFIKSFGEKNLLAKRSNMPLGKYFFYEKFLHRNKAINTLSQTYPEIAFVKQDFHLLSPEKKWQEWSSHKLHWIIPVLNDLPIRFFDALITGGIPLIPSGLTPYVESLQIPKEFYATYGPLDILNPKNLIEVQNHRFDSLGPSGVMERHEFALRNFHVDVILNKLIGKTLELYQIANRPG
jgi:hypothetical protein